MACFLVIDDDNTLRQLMVSTLETAGHRVMQAASGSEATALFKNVPADVVVTDVIMPADSIDLVVALHQQHPKVPFIVVSGLGVQAARTQEIAKALGARQTLAKPFRLPDFLAATDAVVAELPPPPAPPTPAKKKWW